MNSLTNIGEVGVVARLCIRLLRYEKVGELDLDSQGPRNCDLEDGDFAKGRPLPSSELLEPLFLEETGRNDVSVD